MGILMKYDGPFIHSTEAQSFSFGRNIQFFFILDTVESRLLHTLKLNMANKYINPPNMENGNYDQQAAEFTVYTMVSLQPRRFPYFARQEITRAPIFGPMCQTSALRHLVC